MYIESENFDFLENCKDGFGYRGSHSKTHHVSVKPRVTPVITPARRVPIALRE